MEHRLEVAGVPCSAYSFDTVVVGTGCAGLSAAERLTAYGRNDIAIVTDNLKGGTSRNTGSDKQTYYKMTLAGDIADSVREMAQTLKDGGCVDGEHALCEAALSVPCFLRMCEMGVPFPQNRYGEYIGYKTDHDPRRRATSAGPLTSRLMAEALEKEVRRHNIPMYEDRQVISVLVQNGKALGLLCLHIPLQAFELFFCNHVVYATGGPAGIYQDSCYPRVHMGMSGAVFAAGARGKNLTEWQYGLASIKPRWNVSGTFMQVLPRFFSTNAEGGDEREFLAEALSDAGRLLSLVFLKGYQWPFDVRKAMKDSSLVDLLVYQQKLLGRRVFLDYTQNPLGSRFSFSGLIPEAYAYLESAGALFGTPVERLAHMNAPALEFYAGRGVDLAVEPLEIALCSQHHNGGVGVDAWWQSSIEGLFVVGEAAGTHGVYRPGGTALNAGQVGSERAARWIARQKRESIDIQARVTAVRETVQEILELAQGTLGTGSNLEAYLGDAVSKMSKYGAAVRDPHAIEVLLDQVEEKLANFTQTVQIQTQEEWPQLFRYRDILISQRTILFAMKDYLLHGGHSRGAALYSNPQGVKPVPTLPDSFAFILQTEELEEIQEVFWEGGVLHSHWRPARPLPPADDFFENVWRGYRENGNIY